MTTIRPLHRALLDDDLKQDAHVGLGHFGVKVLRRGFIFCGMGLAVADGGNSLRGEDPLKILEKGRDEDEKSSCPQYLVELHYVVGWTISARFCML